MAPIDRHRRAQLATCAIILLGWGGALSIYLTAATPSVDPLQYELENSRAYRRALEMYGGKANVLASEFMDWFHGLWHGTTLAFTVAVITVAVAAVYHFIASPVPPGDDEYPP